MVPLTVVPSSDGKVTEAPVVLLVAHAGVLADTRALLFRAAGFNCLVEADMERVVEMAFSDSIDAVVLCHSLDDCERSKLVKIFAFARTLMPVIWLVEAVFEDVPQNCWATKGDPESLMGLMRSLLDKDGRVKPMIPASGVTEPTEHKRGMTANLRSGRG